MAESNWKLNDILPMGMAMEFDSPPPAWNFWYWGPPLSMQMTAEASAPVGDSRLRMMMGIGK